MRFFISGIIALAAGAKATTVIDHSDVTGIGVNGVQCQG